jgi:hypothetical protein
MLDSARLVVASSAYSINPSSVFTCCSSVQGGRFCLHEVEMFLIFVILLLFGALKTPIPSSGTSPTSGGSGRLISLFPNLLGKCPTGDGAFSHHQNNLPRVHTRFHHAMGVCGLRQWKRCVDDGAALASGQQWPHLCFEFAGNIGFLGNGARAQG